MNERIQINKTKSKNLKTKQKFKKNIQLPFKKAGISKSIIKKINTDNDVDNVMQTCLCSFILKYNIFVKVSCLKKYIYNCLCKLNR